LTLSVLTSGGAILLKVAKLRSSEAVLAGMVVIGLVLLISTFVQMAILLSHEHFRTLSGDCLLKSSELLSTINSFLSKTLSNSPSVCVLGDKTYICRHKFSHNSVAKKIFFLYFFQFLRKPLSNN
jgi:membrane-associated PAP2 superfamily phosphatase